MKHINFDAKPEARFEVTPKIYIFGSENVTHTVINAYLRVKVLTTGI